MISKIRMPGGRDVELREWRDGRDLYWEFPVAAEQRVFRWVQHWREPDGAKSGPIDSCRAITGITLAVLSPAAEQTRTVIFAHSLLTLSDAADRALVRMPSWLHDKDFQLPIRSAPGTIMRIAFDLNVPLCEDVLLGIAVRSITPIGFEVEKA